MGKSDKKVKTDRINVLRKQYDAFLEEDKRRKERNEYILGRLDKMRYCTAMVPLRHKPALYIRDNISTSSSLSQLNKNSFDLSRQFDETTVLQEISKKYILIPKIRSSNEVDNISTQTFKPAFEENGDWKSKYEILDHLKKREKESDASVYAPEISQSHKYDNFQEKGAQKYYEDKVDQPALSYKYEMPEKDEENDKCSDTVNQFGAKIENESNDLIYNQIQESHLLNEEPQTNTSADNTVPQNDEIINNNSEKLQIHKHIHQQIEPTPKLYNEAVPKDENIDQNLHNEPMGSINGRHSPVEEDKDTTITEKVYPEDIQSVEVIRPDDLIKQINNTAPNVASENTENYQYPIETFNVQDFTPDNQVTLQDGVNVNPEGYPAEMSNTYALGEVTSTFDNSSHPNTTEIIETTDDNSGIEAFDAEQREMFYSEGANENYGYNQDNLTEGYEQELPDQGQGVDYSQAETAVFYEGYDAEQVNPVEINEHEEANQRYDPNYEQQYATNYVPQENQEGYEQVYIQDPQYEGDVNKVQEGLEQFQFEQQHEYETVENIEQQLDTEQGYNEQIIMSNIEKPIEDLQTKAPKPKSTE